MLKPHKISFAVADNQKATRRSPDARDAPGRAALADGPIIVSNTDSSTIQPLPTHLSKSAATPAHGRPKDNDLKTKQQVLVPLSKHTVQAQIIELEKPLMLTQIRGRMRHLSPGRSQRQSRHLHPLAMMPGLQTTAHLDITLTWMTYIRQRRPRSHLSGKAIFILWRWCQTSVSMSTLSDPILPWSEARTVPMHLFGINLRLP